ncbi:hypothetical protein LIA77_11883 [Sarocladium implicatum]|nr:hypothetical protein LIA77_11883 [Sarocladium implicatum]
MQLTGLVALGLLALKVTAIGTDAGNDVEVRDILGENLDVRAPEDADLEARGGYGGYNKCGHGAYWKHGACHCHKKWEKYDVKAKRCYKPFECKGDNVKVEGYGYEKKCVCTIEGQVYDKEHGCQCPEGYSLNYGKDKCIKDCAAGEKYSEEHETCYTPCVGKWVKDEWSGYPPAHTCTCKKPGFVYDASKGGCYYPCPENSHYDWKEGSCKCDTYGYIIKDNVCVAPCKGDNYYFKHDKCYCKSKDEVYDEELGCKPRCPEDQKYNWHSKQCECKKEDYIIKDGVCVAPCVGENVVFKYGHCKCTKYGEVYDEVKGCQPRCPADQKYNWKKRECECKEYGKIIKDGVCVAPCVGEGYYYKHGQCYCKSKDQEYDALLGCKNRCDGDAKYNWHTSKCECPKGYEYKAGTGCVKYCKPPATLEYDTCKCPGDQKYDWKKGCYCPWGQKYDEEHAKCYKPCSKPHQVIEWTYSGEYKCVCKKGYKPTRWGCEKKKYGGY